MSERLTIVIGTSEDNYATALYRWGAYTDTAYDLTRTIVEFLKENKGVYVGKELVIKALESTGAVPLKDEDKGVADYTRGVIVTDETGMLTQIQNAHAIVDVYIDDSDVDFGVFFHKDSLNDALEDDPEGKVVYTDVVIGRSSFDEFLSDYFKSVIEDADIIAVSDNDVYIPIR